MKAVIVHLAPSPMPPEGSSAREAVRQIEQEGRRAQAPVLAKLAQLRRDGHVRHVRLAVDRERGGAVGGRQAPSPPSRLARTCARSRPTTVLPIQPADAVTGEPGIASTGRARLLGPGRGWAGDHRRSPRHGRRPDAPRARRPLPRRQQQLVRPLRPARSPCRPQRPRHPGHGRDRRRRRHRHGARCKVHRRAGLRRRGRAAPASAIHLAFQWLLDPDGNPCSPTMLPNVVNLSWGARQGCNLRIPARPARAALGGHSYRSPPPATMVRPSRRRRPSRRTTRPPTFPRRSQSERRRARTAIAPFSSAGPSSCGGGQFPALVAPGTGIRSTGLRRPRRDRARGNVVLGPARRRRARAAAPGRPAAHRRRAGEPARRRAPPTSARRDRIPRSVPASSTSSQPRGCCTPPRSTSTLRRCRRRRAATRRSRRAPMMRRPTSPGANGGRTRIRESAPACP